MGGFYLQPGDPNNWVVHLQGGGWCINEADCLSRSTTNLGSSKAWPAIFNADGGPNGWLSSSESVNPSFWNATKVFVGYCDGASFAGNIPGGIVTGGTRIYFAGGAILDATISTLLGLGMESAASVILKGCSAGGLATYLHADYVGTKLNPKSASGRGAAAPCSPPHPFMPPAPLLTVTPFRSPVCCGPWRRLFPRHALLRGPLSLHAALSVHLQHAGACVRPAAHVSHAA